MAKRGKQNQLIGKAGEKTGADFLIEKGYQILARNVKTPLGEIDLVAEDHGTLVFIEEKTRRSSRFGTGEEAVNLPKQIRLSRLASWYLARRSTKDQPVRFDVLAVDLSGEKSVVRLTQNAFEAHSFVR